MAQSITRKQKSQKRPHWSAKIFIPFVLFVLLLLVVKVWVTLTGHDFPRKLVLEISAPTLDSGTRYRCTMTSLKKHTDISENRFKKLNQEIKELLQNDNATAPAPLIEERKSIVVENIFSQPNSNSFLGKGLTKSEFLTLQKMTENCVEEQISQEGILQITHAHGENLAEARDSFFLTSESGEKVLLLGEDIQRNLREVVPGTRIRVAGYKVSNIMWNSSKMREGLYSAMQGDVTILDQAPRRFQTDGIQYTAVLPVIVKGYEYESEKDRIAIYKEYLKNANFSFKENSYGKMWLSGYRDPSSDGDFYDSKLIELDDIDCYDQYGQDLVYYQLQIQNVALKAFDSDVDFTKYRRIIAFVQHPCRVPFSTLGELPILTEDGIVWLSFATVDYPGMGATVHELGHSLGLRHSGFFSCESSSLPQKASDCTFNGYGDPSTPMGGIETYSNGLSQHFTGAEKEQLNWFADTNKKFVNKPGTYILYPLSQATDQLQTLVISTSASQRLHVEYRQPVNLDDNELFVERSDYYDGALLHLQSFNAPNQSNIILLDPTYPTNTFTASLHQGETFIMPHDNVCVRVNEKDDLSSLSVSVFFNKNCR